jgi:hypothetical protein
MYLKRRNPYIFADAKILKFDVWEGLDSRFRGNDGVLIPVPHPNSRLRGGRGLRVRVFRTFRAFRG